MFFFDLGALFDAVSVSWPEVVLCAQRVLSRACARSDTRHETLPVLMLKRCTTAQAGLWFLMQHQQEGRALALVRSGFKTDAPGGVDCWAVEFCLPIQLPVPRSYLSHVHSLLGFPTSS